MGKQGPCYHCGVTSTPLWRNGPPEKPILCNACGSRWRTKGTLANYTPLHARVDLDEFDDDRVPRGKSIFVKNKEVKLVRRKQNYDNAVVGGFAPDHNQPSEKGLDEDISNRSSSGSAISNSESCVQFGGADASDLTGPSQSVVWDTMVPSRKRTCVSRPKQSPVEKLTKDLYTILHEHQSSHFSGSSEEDLLFGSDTPMVSVEIGHGSVLFRHPSSIVREEESEASSLSVDNKPHLVNEAYSHLTSLPVYTDNKCLNSLSSGIEKSKRPAEQGMQQGQLKRDKVHHEAVQILQNRNSPLCYVDLKGVLNFDVFASHLTNEEQLHLLKYLPCIDTAQLPDRLKSMFSSPQFEENLSSFQKLLVEGVFDLSFSGVKSESCTTLNRLALSDFTKSEWLEQYNLLKDVKFKTSNRESVNPGGSHLISSGSTSVKRSLDGQFLNCPGLKTTIKSPRGAMKGGYERKELMDTDASCFSPRSLFALPPESGPLMLDSFQFIDSDQDLLLDVPSNSSFPEAELLPSSSFAAQASSGSSFVYPRLHRP
ncbi:GATA transcription factor 26-like [Diospyros lotus]|uniref:GATA transcription factor 26-like n=1 Tax=Diospyros lotus TaxID=55363 RepID=UPI002255B9FB|nr:GATA transcription factor 26-like [Diospyros lotus]